MVVVQAGLSSAAGAAAAAAAEAGAAAAAWSLFGNCLSSACNSYNIRSRAYIICMLCNGGQVADAVAVVTPGTDAACFCS